MRVDPVHTLVSTRARMLAALARRTALRQGVELGDAVRFDGIPIITRLAGSTIRLGDATHLCSDSRSTALGVHHPVILRTLATGALLEIGRDVGISGGAVCAARRVRIGDGTLLGANVIVIDTDFHPVHSEARRHAPLPDPAPEDEVEIGSNVFLGTGSIVLKGSRIGDGAVIGAGCVVSGTVAAGAVVRP